MHTEENEYTLNELANFFLVFFLNTAMITTAISSTQTDKAATDSTAIRIIRTMSRSAGDVSETPSVTEQRKEENAHGCIHAPPIRPFHLIHTHTHSGKASHYIQSKRMTNLVQVPCR